MEEEKEKQYIEDGSLGKYSEAAPQPFKNKNNENFLYWIIDKPGELATSKSAIDIYAKLEKLRGLSNIFVKPIRFTTIRTKGSSICSRYVLKRYPFFDQNMDKKANFVNIGISQMMVALMIVECSDASEFLLEPSAVGFKNNKWRFLFFESKSKEDKSAIILYSLAAFISSLDSAKVKHPEYYLKLARDDKRQYETAIKLLIENFGKEAAPACQAIASKLSLILSYFEDKKSKVDLQRLCVKVLKIDKAYDEKSYREFTLKEASLLIGLLKKKSKEGNPLLKMLEEDAKIYHKRVNRGLDPLEKIRFSPSDRRSNYLGLQCEHFVSLRCAKQAFHSVILGDESEHLHYYNCSLCEGKAKILFITLRCGCKVKMNEQTKKPQLSEG